MSTLTSTAAALDAASPFTVEHEALRRSVRRFVEAELAPHTQAWEDEEYFADWVFPRLGALGYLGLDRPQDLGGQGGDYLSAVVFMEELVRPLCGGLALGVGAHTHLVMPPLQEFGTPEQHRRWLTPMIRGELVGCLGITEPEAGSDVASLRTRAVRDGDGWVLDGSKVYITNGMRADVILLVARTSPPGGTGSLHDGITLFLVDLHSPGVTRSPLRKLGMHASDTALLTFEGVRVPDDAVLGRVDAGFHQLMWQLQGERMIGAAGAVATAQAAFERTLEFTRQRQAFGRPIARFQATRHRLAAMATDLEAARRLTYATAVRWAAGEYPVREISMAKLFATRVACDVLDHCVQLHGGAGYMREQVIERAWRDVRLFRIGGGTDEIMLEIIGRTYDV